MALIKQKGNMYDFVDFTWNVLAGACLHSCVYCSTNKLMKYPNTASKYSGELRLDEKYLKDNLGSDRFIFVCAQNDLFADGIDSLDIYRVIQVCLKFPENRYLFQTKNPSRFIDFAETFPENSVLGTTIESNIDWGVSKAPSIRKRVDAMEYLSQRGFETMITIEPILKFGLNELCYLIKKCNPSWVNIGADSGNNNLPEPSSEDVKALIEELERMGIKTVTKNNINRLLRKGK